MTIPRQLAALLASAAVLVAVVGCGEEPVSYSDKDIIDRLNLQKSADGDRYAVDGDPFCEVEAKLLNSADEVEEFEGAPARVALGVPAMEHQDLADLPLDRVQRVERGHRLLEDHRDLVAADLAHRGVGQVEQVLPHEADLAVCDSAWRIQELDDRKTER